MRTGARQADDGSDVARRCPALFICAPASGQGKITVTAALARSNPETTARWFAP